MVTPQLLFLFGSVLTVIMEGVIGLRVVLKLMGASTSAPFVRWVYETSKPILYPFEGMFPSSHIGGVPFTIEFSSLFAIFFYMIVGYLLQELIYFVGELRSRRKQQHERKDK